MQDHLTRADEILSSSATKWPQHPAIIDTHGNCSFLELEQAARSVRHHLVSSGVTPGSIVGISFSDARSFLATLFGVLQADCVAIPLAPDLPLPERHRLITESSVSCVLQASPLHPSSSSQVFLLSFPEITLRIELMSVSSISDSPILHIFPDAAVMRHTSGTTARSKGVVLSHQAVLERTEASMKLLEVSHDDRVLAPLPLSYHFIASAMSCLRAGATILDSEISGKHDLFECTYALSASIIYASPIQYDQLNRSTSFHPMPSLRRAISTAALLDTRAADAFFERFGVQLTQVYGIIEVGLPLWNSLESINRSALGICRPPYECMVADEQGQPVSEGDLGELLIRGPGLFSGYFFGNNAGSPRSSDQWFNTGDLVTQDELGVVIYRGRKKSVINSGGNKIFPEEVEAVLKDAPDIRAVRVVGELHPLLGQSVVAEIVVSSSAKPSTDSWRALCSRELSAYKVPQEFRVVDSLPLTSSGKIVRH